MGELKENKEETDERTMSLRKKIAYLDHGIYDRMGSDRALSF